MTKDGALKLALEALKTIDEAMPFPVAKLAQAAIEEALAHDDEDAIIIQYHEATIKILEKRIEELTAQPEPSFKEWTSDHVRDNLHKLKAQPEQEPVARVIDNGTPEGATEWIPFTSRDEPLKIGDLLYTTPQRPWVGLTGDEISSCDPYEEIWDLFEIARKLEAKLKEKNTCQE